ncbi:ATP-binding cassette domain-containing protein [Flavisphingomonas formosensis]|uniref:ATP-binding cassette domain-containing protein n=1 Tax=Flavisphingomonas formosensis TaxID=861534 RepID=UPI0012F751A8|nr:ATP-binding cassette domain-containing protein [Sphingomonas formosensis]
MTVYAVERLRIFHGETPLVQDVGFAIARGECVALIGGSGSGKSLTCLTPFGLTPMRATGSARLIGEELIGRPERALAGIRARAAGFIFQQPLTALTPHLTIGAQLAEAWMQAGAPRPGRGELTAALARVGLDRPEERLHHHPHRLSGGQRQRVLIAMAIAHRPRLLVADEPTSALDAILRGEMMALLTRLRREEGLALLLVSHDLASVADHADRIVVLNQGRVEESGAAAQLLAAPASAYTRALLAATPRLDDPAPALPAPGETLLAARDVRVSFPRPGWRRGRAVAVENAALSIAEGEAVALVGGSGSGKSTLARAVARIGPADHGTVDWRGTPLPSRTRMTPLLRRLIQPVFQDPVASLDPRWQVADIVAEPLHHLRPELDAAARRDRVMRALGEVELDTGYADRRPNVLSGGQAQRVAIARAIVADPELLLLDEATSALDVLVAGRVLALLERLQRTRGLALLMISHDLAAARRLCHRILVMDDGRIVEEGPTERIIAAPAHPVTQRLVAAST